VENELFETSQSFVVLPLFYLRGLQSLGFIVIHGLLSAQFARWFIFNLNVQMSPLTARNVSFFILVTLWKCGSRLC